MSIMGLPFFGIGMKILEVQEYTGIPTTGVTNTPFSS